MRVYIDVVEYSQILLDYRDIDVQKCIEWLLDEIHTKDIAI